MKTYEDMMAILTLVCLGYFVLHAIEVVGRFFSN